MPPQIPKAGAGPAVQQNINDESKDVAKSASVQTSGTTQSAESTSKQEQLKHEPKDAKDSAKVALGSKQNATEQKGQHNVQAQILKKDLQKQVPSNELGSVHKSMKGAGAAFDLSDSAAVTAETLSSAGDFLIRQQNVRQLSQRAYPQDKVKGQLYEAEDIKPSNMNKVEYPQNSEYFTALSKGEMWNKTAHPKPNREATQDGLEKRLSELNNGAPATPFEKGLVSEWGRSTLNSNAITTLTPIKGPGKEVEAYKVERDFFQTYYDRNGNVLIRTHPKQEPPLEEGIAPWEVIGLVQAGRHLLTAGGKMLAKEAITTAAKAETGAVIRTAEQQLAKAETGTVVNTANKRIASEWQQGSGTSVYAKPTGPSAKAPVSNAPAAKAAVKEFTEEEEKMINEYVLDGMPRKQAEDAIRTTRGPENATQWYDPFGPNSKSNPRSWRR